MMASVVRRYIIIPTPSLDAFLQRSCSTPVLDGFVARCSWTVSHLRHEQSARIGAEHHALRMASGVRCTVIIPTPSLDAFLQRYSSTLVLDGVF